MSIQITYAGAQSLTAECTQLGTPTFLSISDWNNLPSGQLKTLLTARYISASDPESVDYAAFGLACANAGLSISEKAREAGSYQGNIVLSLGVLDGFGPLGCVVFVPRNPLTATGGVVRIETAYSASE